eukprot:TRINITY_DN7431_c0_g1_i8.p1 TRINITY_DN7431_c0_g1~~TRINITY_DN7431_c0_g1_i8.p1  ORF type:complete len:273 (+),score=32.35 TRINITY_DN7431_c0_g1_i8:317-1135(+)
MMHIKALGGWDKTGSRINSEKSKHFETLGTKNYSMVTNTSFRPDTKSMSKCLNMKHKLTKKMKNTKIELLDANCKKVLVDALENTKNAILNVTRHLHKRRHMRHKTTFVRKEPKKLLELKAEVREEKHYEVEEDGKKLRKALQLEISLSQKLDLFSKKPKDKSFSFDNEESYETDLVVIEDQSSFHEAKYNNPGSTNTHKISPFADMVDNSILKYLGDNKQEDIKVSPELFSSKKTKQAKGTFNKPCPLADSIISLSNSQVLNIESMESNKH